MTDRTMFLGVILPLFITSIICFLIAGALYA